MSANLNPDQKLVVEEIDSPLLVIAGPGSGKTKTLVERILHLVVNKKIPAEKILVATFTEKASKELITRVSNRAIELGVEINLTEMYIGTLHSIFLRIIEENRPKTTLMRNYRLLDDFEQKYLIHRSLAQFQALDGFSSLVEGYSRWDQAEAVAGLVNKVSEENLEIERLLKSTIPVLAVLGQLTQIYHGMLKDENALDFSTIQSTMWNLINTKTEVLESLREKISYLMIDEYQDTNTIQEKILLKLAAPLNRICVVGDDDQGLYRFRGATIKNILEFSKNFPEGHCKRYELVTNYRSHPGIVEFYNRWMTSMPKEGDWEGLAGEQYRYPKEIKAQDKAFGDYKSVVKVMGEITVESWHEEVLSFIKSFKEEGVSKDLNQFAFLFKSVKNEKAIGLAHYLEAHGVPVFSPRSALFFDREEVKLLFGALVFMFPRLIERHLKWNAEAHLDDWEYYSHCEELFTQAVRSNFPLHKPLVSWCASKAKIHETLDENTDYSFSDLFYGLLAFPLFSKFVDIDLDKGVQDLRPVYNLALFSQLLTRYEYLHNVIVISKDGLTQHLQGLFNRYFRFLREGGIGEYEDFDFYAPTGCVSFMTIHQSKGLEFPVVLVDSLNSVPTKATEAIEVLLDQHYRSGPGFEPVERIKYFDFWRLYYTAFSRAQNLLVLTGAHNPEGRGRARLPSRYFLPVYEGLPSWEDGDLTSDRITLDQIKPVNIKHEYSFTSHILLYENCPLQYKFFRELEFSPVRTNAVLFGTLVHQTIEDVHKTVLEGHPEQVTNEQISLWLGANYASLSKATRTYLAPSVLRAIDGHVRRYVEKASKDWSVVQEAEVSVSLLKPEYILKGTIDLIRGKEGTVEILDFKTEKKPDVNDPDGKVKLERYQRQLEIYSHIVEERYGHKVSRMHLYYTGEENSSPYVSFNYDQKKVDQTIGVIDKVVGRIETKNFDHSRVKRTKELCNHCDVKPFCWRNG